MPKAGDTALIDLKIVPVCYYYCGVAFNKHNQPFNTYPAFLKVIAYEVWI